MGLRRWCRRIRRLDSHCPGRDLVSLTSNHDRSQAKGHGGDAGAPSSFSRHFHCLQAAHASLRDSDLIIHSYILFDLALEARLGRELDQVRDSDEQRRLADDRDGVHRAGGFQSGRARAIRLPR